MLAAGETIWYSIYVVIGPSHQYSNDSKVVHVELIGPDGEIAVSQTHALDNGKGSGTLEIPKKLQDGSYQLRSYTQWMRNFDTDFFFTKTLYILNTQNKQDVLQTVDDKIDLQFFPEGGHLVAGIASKVSFKAHGSDGLPRKVSGKILNSKRDSVASLRTLDGGSGFFHLLPNKGDNYFAKLDDGTQFLLPEIRDNGYIVTVNNRNEKRIKVTIQATESLRDRPFYILAHMRQRNYFHDKFEFGQDQILKFEIPKKDIPGGILTLTLFDSDKKPWAERAIFISNEEGLVINTKINSDKFLKREKVTIEINVKDRKGRPVATNLSMAVTDMDQINKNKNSNTILNHLLLNSEIKGDIIDPGLPFVDKKMKIIEQLDLVMLTNSMRKYHWSQVWGGDTKQKTYDFQKGLVVSGTALKLNGKPLPNTSLKIIEKSNDKIGMFTTRTDAKGAFAINDINFENYTDLVFNALNSYGNGVDVKIILDSTNLEKPPTSFKSQINSQPVLVKNQEVYSKLDYQSDAIYNDVDTVILDNVVVIEKREETESLYGLEPDSKVFTEDYPALADIFTIIRRIPGVKVVGSGLNTMVSLRRGGNPLWIVDGHKYFGSSSEPIPIFVSTMDINSIEKIEIYKGSSAAFISGIQGHSGVIIIYTKSIDKINKVKAPIINVLGHSNTKEFYSPKYDMKPDANKTFDNRATLYWNSSITTDKDGNATIEFYNSDVAKQIQLSIEGLSPDGIPGTYLETIGESE